VDAVVEELAGVRVLRARPDRPVSQRQDALDLLGASWGTDVEIVVLDVADVAPECFDLRTGLLGELLQTFVNYRIRVALVGDLTAPLATSGALRDFVVESNRGRQVWFLADEAELGRRLAGPGTAPPAADDQAGA
jgi:hypothetical protein